MLFIHLRRESILRGKKLTVAQRNTVLKFGRGLGLNEKNIGDWLYKSLEYVDISGGGLGRWSTKQERYNLINAKTGEILCVPCNIMK